MAVKVRKQTLRKWLREYETGKRSKLEIERDELGTSGRGKTVTRLWQRELGVDTTTAR